MWPEKAQAVSMEKDSCTKTISTNEKDIEYVFKICSTLAGWIFLWPINPQHSAIYEIIKVFGNIFCLLLIIFELSNCFLHNMFELKTFQQRLSTAGYTVFTIVCFLRYIFLLSGGKKIKKCIKYVKEDYQNFQTEKQRDLMLKNVQFGHYLSIVMAIVLYGGGLWYNMVWPVLSESVVTERNKTIKPFSTPTYGVYATISPFYEFMFALKLLIQFVCFSTNIVAFSLTSTFSIHACGQFELIISELNKLIADTEKSQLNDKLILIFKHHLRILKFVADLKNCVSSICFVELIGCTLDMCLLSYYIMIAWKEHDMNSLIPFVMFIISVIFSIYIYSYIGELLTTKATEFGQCAYMIKWYDIPKSTSLNLIHLIRISHFPCQLTAGKFFILSMYTFGSVVKSAAVYCNFIWKMLE